MFLIVIIIVQWKLKNGVSLSRAAVHGQKIACGSFRDNVEIEIHFVKHNTTFFSQCGVLSKRKYCKQ